VQLVITCEHAGNEVPQELQYLFEAFGGILESHLGYDPGAVDLHNHLSKLAHFSHFHKISRLVVEPNRSLHHRQLFSEFTKELSDIEKKEILQRFYFPYRNIIEKKIKNLLKNGEKVLHISVHTFTPELNGSIRNADIGLLYDPAVKEEKYFCKTFKYQLQLDNSKNVRFNYPYLGKSDGLTSFLRKKFSSNYLGIEMEVNQKFVRKEKMEPSVKALIFRSLENSL